MNPNNNGADGWIGDYNRWQKELKELIDSIKKCDVCRIPIGAEAIYLNNNKQVCHKCYGDALVEWHQSGATGELEEYIESKIIANELIGE